MSDWMLSVRRWIVSTLMPREDKIALEQARHTLAWRYEVMQAEGREMECLSVMETLIGVNRILWSNER